jgi:outer membrane protein
MITSPHGPLARAAAWVALATMLLIGAPAFAQDSKPLPIAILDVQRVVQKSKAAQTIRSQIEKMRTDFQAQVRDEEQALRRADQELAQQRAILAPDAYEARRKEFEERARQAQQRVQERKRKLEHVFGEAMGQVQQAMQKATADIAKERDLALVLPRQSVVLSETRLDISTEVLARLDKTLPSVAVKAPAD